MSSHRAQRVADLIGREIASMLQKDVKDPRIGIITITGAEVSPDLKLARVFYTVLGGEEQRESTAEGIAHARGFMRGEIGRRLELKSVPELRFYYDDTLDRSIRIEKLLGGTDEPDKSG